MKKNIETCLERESIQGAKQCLFEMLQLFRKLKLKTENVSEEEFVELFYEVDDVLLTIDNEMAVSRDFVVAEKHELALSKAYSDGFKCGVKHAVDTDEAYSQGFIDGNKYALETADH